MKKENIALIIILAIQLLVYIFLGVQKSYIHMDEAYSIGLTNYDKVEITDNEDFMEIGIIVHIMKIIYLYHKKK